MLSQRPTGTGKTVLFCAITGVVTEGGAQTLILQHREELIGQTSRTLAKMKVEHGVIAGGRPGRAAPVQIASINTISRRLGAYQSGEFRLVFVDAAHHAAAPSWQRVIDYFDEAYVIGCTATPERLDGKGLDHLFGELVAGRSVKEYVELGVLAPAVTFASPEPPGHSGVRRRLGDFEQTALADRMSNSAIVGDAIEHYRRLSPQLPGLVYCCSVRHSQLVAEAFSAVDYAARHVDDETPAAERVATIDALRDGKLDMITNVALFTEGLDVPLLGIVIILRPTQPLTLHLQILGRVTRTARGKRRGLILDHAGNSLRHGLYDFEHQWSLDSRPKKAGEPLVRRCPEFGAMLPIKAQSCSECGYQFVVQMQPPRIPESTAGDLERIDGRNMLDAEQLPHMPYHRLLDWCGTDDIRVELARRARGYRQGWKFHAKQARLAAMASVERHRSQVSPNAGEGGNPLPAPSPRAIWTRRSG